MLEKIIDFVLRVFGIARKTSTIPVEKVVMDKEWGCAKDCDNCHHKSIEEVYTEFSQDVPKESSDEEVKEEPIEKEEAAAKEEPKEPADEVKEEPKPKKTRKPRKHTERKKKD